MDLRKRLKRSILLYRMNSKNMGSPFKKLILGGLGRIPWVGARYGLTKEITAKGAYWLFINRQILNDKQRLDLRTTIEKKFLGDKKLARKYADYLKAEKNHKEASVIYRNSFTATPDDKQIYENLIACLYMSGEHSAVLRHAKEYISKYYPSFGVLSYAYFSACIEGCVTKVSYLEKIKYFPASYSKENQLKVGAQLFFEWADRGFIKQAYDYKYAVAHFFSRADLSPGHTYLNYQKIAADIFQGDFKRASERLSICSQNESRLPHAAKFHEVQSYISIALSEKNLKPCGIDFGEVYIANDPEDPYRTNRFKGMLSGKRIAVVGPADTGQDLSEEIDGYDVVVRTNVFSRDDFVLDGGRLGKRVDIAYYPRAPVGLRKDELIKFSSEELCTLVFRNERSVEEYGKENLRPQDRIVSGSPCNFMPVFQSMHAIQRIIWDLIKYQPEEVKVFNVNFYAGSLYHEKYRPGGQEPDLKSLGLQHDPLQSFMFSKMLYKAGVVKFDVVASRILEMPDSEYIDYLQKSYGDVWRSAEA